jgi:hypothetical protein
VAVAGFLTCVLALAVLTSGAARAADTPRHKPTKLWSEFPLGETQPPSAGSLTPPRRDPGAVSALPPRRDPDAVSALAPRAPASDAGGGNSTTLFFLALALAGITLVSVAVVGRHARRPAAPALLAANLRKGAQSMTRFNRKNTEQADLEKDDAERAVVRLADKMSSYSVDDESSDDDTEAPSSTHEEVSDDETASPAVESSPAAEADTASTPSSYAELGAHVSTMLAVTEETARQIVADARAEAEAIKEDAKVYAEKRKRDAQENASRITARAADDARSLEQAGNENRARMDEESERHRQLVHLSQTVEETLRQTIVSGRETLDELESMVDELAGEAAGWEEPAPVERATA